MLSFFGMKDAVYIAIMLALAGAAWYVLDDWHYKPLRECRHTEANLQEVGAMLNDCKADVSKRSIESFIEGIGEDNELPDTTLTDLHT